MLHYALSNGITIVRSFVSSKSNSINLIYIRAAIQAATGVTLTLKEVRQYLLEEGLITPSQAKKEATIFRGYSEFYDYDYGENPSYSETQEELDFNFEFGQQDMRGW